MARTGAKALAVAGVLVAAAGFGWQSTMGVHGSYLTSVCLPGVLMMAGAGLASTPLATLATSGAAPGDAGTRLRAGQHLPHDGRRAGPRGALHGRGGPHGGLRRRGARSRPDTPWPSAPPPWCWWPGR